MGGTLVVTALGHPGGAGGPAARAESAEACVGESPVGFL